MMRRFAAFCMFVLCAGASFGAVATLIVVPNDRTTLEGGTNTCAPLSGCFNIDRYQQRYASTQFAALTGPELITEIAFRPDQAAAGSPISITFLDVEIMLSTLNPPLSPTFAHNLGSDATTVYSGALSLNSPNAPPPNPGLGKAFDFIIPLMTPFLYDPAGGDLLFEFKNYSGESGAFAVDAVSTFPALTQSVRAAGGAGADATSGTLSNIALVTRFTTMPAPIVTTPEPASSSLLLLALVSLGLRAHARRCHRARV